MNSTITLAIADDHHLFRAGLTTVLGNYPEFQVVGEAENGQELLDMVQEKRPDIVLMDIRMPLLDGLEATARLRDHFPDTKVIALSMYNEDAIIFQMISLGACAFLTKNIESNELAFVIRTVYLKGRYFSDSVTEVLAKGLSRSQEKAKSQEVPLLTRREIEVVRLMASEFTNQEIGNILHLSARTVEGHRKRIQDKIGAKNMAGIIVFAVKQGLVD